MKKALPVIAVVVVATVAVVLLRESPAPGKDVETVEKAVVIEEPILQAEVPVNEAGDVVVVDVAIPERAPLPVSEAPAPEAPPIDSRVGVAADQVVAMVNGVAIHGRDLAPVPSDRASEPVNMSTEMFAFRLSQAIDRELTFQQARKTGIELGERELRTLQNIPDSLIHDETVVDSLGDQQAEVAYEVQQAKARILERLLLEKQGAPAPHVSAKQVEAYYQEHMERFGPLPEDPAEREAAWPAIDLTIRQELAPLAMQAYQEERRVYFENLRTSAQINTYLQTSAP